jgi:hypothetical protein
LATQLSFFLPSRFLVPYREMEKPQAKAKTNKADEEHHEEERQLESELH